MIGFSEDSKLLLRLCLHLAPLMPSAEAEAHASLEWRVLRSVWLEALAHGRLTEDQVRRAAVGLARGDQGQGVAALLGGANEP